MRLSRAATKSSCSIPARSPRCAICSDQPRFHYIHDSIFNLELIDGLVAKVDLIYHLAAVVGVEHYVGDPYETLNVNVNGTQNMLKAAYKYNKKVVFSSTSEVYGRNPEGAVERGRRSRARRDHDRSLVLLDLEGGRRAFLLRLSQARDAGDGGALLQRLRAAAGQASTSAGCSRSSWASCCAAPI